MPVSVSCPQLGDAVLRARLHEAVRQVVRRFRPSFEAWRLSLFQSQTGSGWDLAISGPRFRKVFTLYGPADDLPGLVSAYVEAILATKAELLSGNRDRNLRSLILERDMPQDTSRQTRGPSDSTDYSSTTAPETKKEAEEQPPHTGDTRLHPGGARGVTADPGMSSLDRDMGPHQGRSPGQQDIGATRNDGEGR